MSFDLTGKNELIIWAITCLRSSWYIKNPFLKAKINEVRSDFYFTQRHTKIVHILLDIMHNVKQRYKKPPLIRYPCSQLQTPEYPML
jgi:hypothetical protein